MTRKRLSNRHEIETISFFHEGIKYHASVGYYDDKETIGEIWMNGGKVGSAVERDARSAAIAASLSLQYGCPVKGLKSSLPKLQNGKPADALGTFLSLVADATNS